MRPLRSRPLPCPPLIAPCAAAEPEAALKNVFIFADGARYEGEFKGAKEQLKRHGSGSFTASDGTECGAARYADARGAALTVRRWCRYVGSWVEDAMSGQGRLVQPDGARFEGSFKDNMFEGRGVYTWPDGSRFEGPWRGGKPAGPGKYVDAAGIRWVGTFDPSGGSDLRAEV